ncbi:nuclear transport factor 2 family protein [Streptomyces lasiicapitis]|uniref:nuclear transport factor 2 family protein n=1 Tax=Streptomyces lasiicapitis TaxID=1923961 RepID=UPI0036777FF0
MSSMTPAEMEALIEIHMKAEERGDPEGSVSVYTDDIEHDVVGDPGGPKHGIPAALEFYRQLVKDFRAEKEERTHTYYSDNAVTIENTMTGTVPGDFLGMPGNGRRISFRILHVFEFSNGRVCRENVWLDGAGVAAQLMAPGK